MNEVDPEGTVSVVEAAGMLGMTGEEAYQLVFRKELRTLEAPLGRRVVRLEVIEAWKRAHPAPAGSPR